MALRDKLPWERARGQRGYRSREEEPRLPLPSLCHTCSGPAWTAFMQIPNLLISVM